MNAVVTMPSTMLTTMMTSADTAMYGITLSRGVPITAGSPR